VAVAAVEAAAAEAAAVFVVEAAWAGSADWA
jgi:hypothetical protein